MNTGQNMLRCGQTNIYLKPECVCTFNNVFEAKNHGYSSCPNGVNSDIVTQLKCRYQSQLKFIEKGKKSHLILVTPFGLLTYTAIYLFVNI